GRYTGPAVHDTIQQGMRQAGAPTNGLRWRCMGAKVYACGVGANLPCGKANPSPQPGAGLATWCNEHPDTQVVPAVATGRETVFSWACQGDVPVIARQALAADARGFVSQFWHELRPPG
ncbi:MAG: hypothetical protein AAB289_16280, partial [Chloroflexota bacterium]